jgi:hypothetical protein
MGFFRKKKGTPLSTSMYQGDNATPARREGKNAPRTPDTVDDDPLESAKHKKQLFTRKNKQKERYVKVTPDKNEGSNEQQQQENEKTALITPTKAPYQRRQTQSSDFIPALITPDSIPALMTPGKYDGLPPTPDFKDDTKRNLNAAFDEGYEADDTPTPANNSEEDKKFLKRFRASWRKSPGKTEQRIMAKKLIEQQEKQSPVPKVIDNDEGSVPSLITEITGQEVKAGTAATALVPIKEQDIETTTANSQPQSFFGPAESFSTTSKTSTRQPLTLGQKFLSLLQCGEDTTDGYFGRIKCLDLCGPMGEKDGLRLEREEETRFVIQFMNVSFLVLCSCIG